MPRNPQEEEWNLPKGPKAFEMVEWTRVKRNKEESGILIVLQLL
jgi:hypothetical protein